MASNSNSSSKFTKFDRNRFRKIYPVNRFPPSESFRSQTAINIESISVPFTLDKNDNVVVNGTKAIGSLNNVYKAIPVIMVAPKVPNNLSQDATADVQDQANVNLFITSLTLDGTGKVSFVIESSTDFAGEAVVTVVSLA